MCHIYICAYVCAYMCVCVCVCEKERRMSYIIFVILVNSFNLSSCFSDAFDMFSISYF